MNMSRLSCSAGLPPPVIIICNDYGRDHLNSGLKLN